MNLSLIVLDFMNLMINFESEFDQLGNPNLINF